MRHTTFNHEFVEFIPSELEEGVLYVSVQYATAVHKCACGCGNKAATPISPVDWQLLFDGDSVSLTPSIGNWGFPCRSHYWIKANKVLWAETWSPEQISAGRLRETRDYERYFASRRKGSYSTGQAEAKAQVEGKPFKSILTRILKLFDR